MDRDEALTQIAEINKVITASNRYFFSPSRLVTYGIVILMIPIISLGIDQLPMFDPHTQGTQRLLITAFRVLFFLGLFWSVGRLSGRYWPEEPQPELHPLIKNAFAICKPILATTIAMIVLLIWIDTPHLVYATTLFFLGILFNLYGRFSSHLVTVVSWSYIIMGFVLGYLAKQEASYIWIVFTTHLGLSYILIGLAGRKRKVQS